jgi:hypothetical protein
MEWRLFFMNPNRTKTVYQRNVKLNRLEYICIEFIHFDFIFSILMKLMYMSLLVFKLCFLCYVSDYKSMYHETVEWECCLLTQLFPLWLVRDFVLIRTAELKNVFVVQQSQSVQDNTTPIWELQVACEEVPLCLGPLVDSSLMRSCGRGRSWQVATEVWMSECERLYMGYMSSRDFVLSDPCIWLSWLFTKAYKNTCNWSAYTNIPFTLWTKSWKYLANVTSREKV